MKLTRVLLATTIIALVSSQIEIEIDFPMSSPKTQGRNPFGVIDKMIENIEEQQSKVNKKDNHRAGEIEIIEIGPMSNTKPQIQFPPFLNSPFFNMKSKPNLVLGPLQEFKMNPLFKKTTSKPASPQIIEINTIIPRNSSIRKKNLRSASIPRGSQRLNSQIDKAMRNEINDDVEQIFNDFFDDIQVSHKKLKKPTQNSQPAKREEANLDKRASSPSNSIKEVENAKSLPVKPAAKAKPAVAPKQQPTVKPKENSKEIQVEEPPKLAKLKENISTEIQGFSFAMHKKAIYIGCYTLFAGLFLFFILHFVLSRRQSESKTEMNDCVKLK